MGKRIVLLWSLGVVMASLQAGGGLPGGFLDDGVGGRSLGLGKAFSGLANDAQAVYYNPAGLAQLYSNDLILMGGTLYGGANQTFVSYALPTQLFGTFAFSYTGVRVSVPPQELERDEPISWSNNGVLLSYAKDLMPFLCVGFNYKVIYNPLTDYTARITQGFDLGLLIFPEELYSFGVMGKNLLQPRVSYEEGPTEDPFPRILRAGAAFKLMDGALNIVSDLSYRLIKSPSLHFFQGLEYFPLPSAALRLGLNQNEFTFGVGLKREMKTLTFGVDYALLTHYRSNFYLEPIHKLSLGFNFGGLRTWIEAKPAVFSPHEQIAWLYLHVGAKREVERWQLLIKNALGETVRAFGAFGPPPLTHSWDGRDDYGSIVPDGRYFYELIVIEAPRTPRRYTGPLVTVKTRL